VAEEGHCFPDNLLALFGHSGAQDCSAETAIRDPRSAIRDSVGAPLTGETSFRDDGLSNDGILPLHRVHRSDRRRVD
jgi:hypothetical protein